MAPLGDGFLGSMGHKHFLKVFVGFAAIIFLALFAYHAWIKKQVQLENQRIADYQAQQ